jgi:hypothetical protein
MNKDEEIAALKKALYEVMPSCNCFSLNDCEELATHMHSDWDGTSYYCKKHASYPATEMPYLANAVKLLKGSKYE